jgi:uncharacterized hydrophobic protein (TIGR00271 family)
LFNSEDGLALLQWFAPISKVWLGNSTKRGLEVSDPEKPETDIEPVDSPEPEHAETPENQEEVSGAEDSDTEPPARPPKLQLAKSIKRTYGLITDVDADQRRTAYDAIKEAALPSFSYYLMVAVSAVVAAFGMLSNSTAVVIGAMLLAPLMGPILGTALGLAADDRPLLKMSLRAEVLGVLGAILVGFIVGSIPFRFNFGSEIIARTAPTIFDLFVAVASGLAGAYAYFDKKISPSLPGVAIAVSLVPPLAVCGLCLADGRFGWASGAFLLFIANFLAIQLSAALVLTGFKMDKVYPREEELRFWKRYGMSLFALLIVGAFLTNTLIQLVRETRYREKVNRLVAAHLSSSQGANLDRLRIEKDEAGNRRMVAVVLAPTNLGPEHVTALEDYLEKTLEEPIELVVRSILTKDFDRTGPVYNLTKDGVDEKAEQIDSEAAFLGIVSQTLSEELAHFPGVEVIDIRRVATDTSDTAHLTVAVRTPKVIEPTQVAYLQETLTQRLDQPVELEVRSVASQAANAEGYVFKPFKNDSPADPEKLKRISDAVRNQLPKVSKGTTLMNLHYRQRENGEVVVLAIVKTPATLTPEQVGAMQKTLRQYIDASTVLIVRSLVNAETAASGYLESFDDSKLFERGLRAEEGVSSSPTPSPSLSPES